MTRRFASMPLPHRSKFACAVLGVSLFLHGCAVPDLDRAKQQLAEGQINAAQQDLAILSDKGVVEAMLLLGDQLGKTEPVQAEIYYLRAAAAGDFKANGRLAKLYSQLAVEAKQGANQLGQASNINVGVEDATKALAYSREALAIGDDSALSVIIKLNTQFPDLQLHDEVESIIKKAQKSGSTNALYAKVLWWESKGEAVTHANEIEKICTRLGALEVGCYRSLITLYSQQQNAEKTDAVIQRVKNDYQAGRLSGAVIEGLATWLVEKNPGEKGPAYALSLLDMVRQRYPDANYELAYLLYRNPGLQYSMTLSQLLEEQQQAGDWRSSEMLGEMYFTGNQRPLDPLKVRELLTPIQDKSVIANYYLGLLARDGLLGQHDAESALTYLLKAARFGHEKADVALAEMFWNAKGIAKNPVYAYSFARIAEIRGSKQGQKLLAEIATSLNLQQLNQAVGISAQELNARQLLKKKHLSCCEIEQEGAALP